MGAITNLQSPEDLRNYAMKALGSPVINIEIDEEQIFDRISDAIQKYILKHYNGTNEVWDFYKVTDADIKNGFITVPAKYIAILDMVDPIKDSFGTGDEFDQLSYRLANSDFFDYTWTLASDMFTSWLAFQEKLELIKQFFQPQRRFRYNSMTGQMQLFGSDWQRPGYFFIWHAYTSIDPTENTNIYNDEWLKRYATALIGQQWGRNVFKYNGIQLPGGVTMNGIEIRNYYDAQVAKLDEEFQKSYMLPIDFMVA
jgi:hypothetical protein